MKYLPLILVTIFVGIANAQIQQTKPVYYFNPNWSPDGKQIVFESTKDGKFAVYTIQTDGSDLRKLTSGESNDEQPRWSPDGKQIVFISDRSGDLRLYTMNADGSGQRRLGNTDDTDYLPEFSPKGDYVVFQSRPEKTSITHDIYIIRTDGTGRTRLTDQTADYLSPRWSPNGKKILFTKAGFISKTVQAEMSKMSRDKRMEIIANRNSSGEIFIMNSDGSNVKNLTNNNVSDGDGEWSKDGRTIYFTSERDGSPNIYAMNADGSKVRKAADGNIVKDINLSPDGKYFAYTKEVNKKWGLYIYDIKSGKEQLLIGENL
jgi:TolB protein